MVEISRECKGCVSIFVAVCLLLMPQVSLAQSGSGGVIYFDSDWCPRQQELDELSKYMTLRLNGCCIADATINPEYRGRWDMLQPWISRIRSFPADHAICTGVVRSKIDQDSYDRDQDRRLENEKLQRRLSYIRQLDVARLCDLHGRQLRGEPIDEFSGVQDAPDMLAQEIRRRRLSIQAPVVKQKEIRVGASECEMFASLGQPDRMNRSVGNWGVRIQYVYLAGRVYVYVSNGKVTGWQDTK